MTDGTQGATDGLRFDGFGLPVAGSTPTPFGFVGGSQYQTDGDTGLLLLGHRYYDASVGRFLTADPAKAGNNWYVYCGNNPLNGVDPLGYMMAAGAILAGASSFAATTEEAGLAADATGVGAPIGVVLGIAGAVIFVGGAIYAGGVYLANRPVPPDKAYPGTDQNKQDKHDPTSDAYDPTKTPLIGHELPPGKTVDDALEDAWNNPVAGDPGKGQTFGNPGYPVNRDGDEWLDLRLGGGKVHGFPVSGPK